MLCIDGTNTINVSLDSNKILLNDISWPCIKTSSTLSLLFLSLFLKVGYKLGRAAINSSVFKWVLLRPDSAVLPSKYLALRSRLLVQANCVVLSQMPSWILSLIEKKLCAIFSRRTVSDAHICQFRPTEHMHEVNRPIIQCCWLLVGKVAQNKRNFTLFLKKNLWYYICIFCNLHFSIVSHIG